MAALQDNFNDSMPSAPSGYRNARWQADPVTVSPRNISSYFPNIGGVDARTTTTETIGIADQGQLVTFTNSGAIAVALDPGVYNQFLCAVQVNGTGTVTFTPSSGQINNSATASITGSSNIGGWLFFDGTNWWLFIGGTGGGGGSVSSVFGRTGAVVAVAGDYGPTTGGTGQTSWTKGDLLVGSGVNTLGKLPVGSDGKVLTANSAATDGVDWETPGSAPVTSVFGRTGAVVAVAGDYDVTKGGTGQTGSTKGDIVVGSGTNTNARLSVGSDGKVLTANSAAPNGVDWETPGGGGGGTVTSVAQTVPAEFSVAGSPITTSGTLAISKQNQSANTAWAGPTSGGAAAPTFRSLVQADLPAQPFDILFNPNVVMGSGAIFDVAVFVRTVIFPGNFSGAAGHCRVNPGSTQTINVNKNGSSIGTISITSGGVFSFTTTSGAAQTYNSGDYMTFTNQAGADASMLMQVTLTGTR